MGFNYKIIYTCPSGYVFFQGKYAKLDVCPTCGLAQYKDVGWSKLPKKVLKHFAFIPWLKQMFRAPTILNLMLHGIVKIGALMGCLACD